MTRRRQILDLIAATTTPGSKSRRLCDVSAEITEMSGAGIMMMSNDTPSGSLCTSNEVSDLIEQLQYTLGEGPCVDAYQHERPVLEPNLADPRVPRWPAFSGPALGAGARAVFGFPIRVGAARLGALNIYRDRQGPLTDGQHADALVMADIVAGAVLTLQADSPGSGLATELEASAEFNYGVHQAAGMIAVQLDCSVGTALVRLRGFAFGEDVPLVDVARAVVDRRIRFDSQ
ncbi:GAF domain-containing protein [soil metagenome]